MVEFSLLNSSLKCSLTKYGLRIYYFSFSLTKNLFNPSFLIDGFISLQCKQ